MKSQRFITILSAVTAVVVIIVIVAVTLKSKKSGDVTSSMLSDVMLMDSGNFNSIGQNNDIDSNRNAENSLNALSSNDNSLSSEEILAAPDKGKIEAAFAIYNSAASKTDKLTAFAFSQNITFSLNIDGTTIDLEKTIVEAKSNGSDYVYNKILSQKDKHNASISSNENYFYGSKSENALYFRYKQSSAIDSANNSDKIFKENYSKKTMSDFLEKPFNIKLSDIANFSNSSESGNNYYKFIIDSEKAKDIIKQMFNSTDFSSNYSNIDVKYFVISITIDSDGYLTSQDFSVNCSVTENNITSSYVIKLKTSLTSRGETNIIEKPDWVLKQGE